MARKHKKIEFSIINMEILYYIIRQYITKKIISKIIYYKYKIIICIINFISYFPYNIFSQTNIFIHNFFLYTKLYRYFYK